MVLWTATVPVWCAIQSYLSLTNHHRTRRLCRAERKTRQSVDSSSVARGSRIIRSLIASWFVATVTCTRTRGYEAALPAVPPTPGLDRLALAFADPIGKRGGADPCPPSIYVHVGGLCGRAGKTTGL